MTNLNPRELDVLNILWSVDEPMMATDIVNVRKELTQSTVTAVLRKLLNDNLVDVVGITHSGRVLSRTYRPTEKSKAVIFQHFLNCSRCFSHVISEAELCAAILMKDKEPKQAETEINKLLEFLDKMKL